MSTVLTFHDYRYFPYERTLALREAVAILRSDKLKELNNGVAVYAADSRDAGRLTYFARVSNGSGDYETTQFRLEGRGVGQKRQSTRYSVHGLHEYKGKFNPQIAKALLNICGVEEGCRVLDPFCGSGTTLVEAAHLGARCDGYDINPFAVFLANAKLAAIHAPSSRLRKTLTEIAEVRRRLDLPLGHDTARSAYLRKWFDLAQLVEVEAIGTAINRVAGADTPIFQAIASNLLRDYSAQDPKDLRIRRRKSPIPALPFLDAFLGASQQFIARLEASQSILGPRIGSGRAVLRDVAREPNGDDDQSHFDVAITSPPYAMALPYIDTQRLSLVWLGLVEPGDIGTLESTLVGNRELSGRDRKVVEIALEGNEADLPASEIDLCRRAFRAIDAGDGFRRKAVPALLYRYFASMLLSFRSVRAELRPGAPYALVVGHNHSTLGGQRIDIDTPQHLASLAAKAGWTVEEVMALQTYQRWGYHAANAVAAESLILLRRS